MRKRKTNEGFKVKATEKKHKERKTPRLILTIERKQEFFEKKSFDRKILPEISLSRFFFTNQHLRTVLITIHTVHFRIISF
jgi:hypothetical protein